MSEGVVTLERATGNSDCYQSYYRRLLRIKKSSARQTEMPMSFFGTEASVQPFNHFVRRVHLNATHTLK